MTRTRTSTLAISGLLCAAALLALPGCDDDGAPELQSTVDELRKDLLDAKKERERLTAKLDRMERRLAGYAQDIDRLQVQGIAGLERAEVAGESGEGTGDAAVDASVDASVDATAAANIEKLLESEGGRQAMEKAMEAIREKRDNERRQRMVEGMVDRFAEQADLTPDQTERLSQIMGKRFEGMRQIWSALRDGGDVSREERAVMREEAMVKMEELRVELDDEVKSVLNADQYSLYQEQADRMRGWGGGGRGGPGGGRR